MINELHNAVGGGCEYGSEQFSHQPETAPEPVHGVIGAHHRGCSSTYSVASYTLGLIHNVFGQILSRAISAPEAAVQFQVTGGTSRLVFLIHSKPKPRRPGTPWSGAEQWQIFSVGHFLYSYL